MKKQTLWQRFGAFIIPVVTMSMMFSAPVSAATCNSSVLAYPAWYNGLQCDKGVVQITEINQIWVIVLNVVQWIIITVGYVTLGMIIWGGFQYITGQGESSKIEAAKSTLLNAIIGLVIALAAVLIVQTIKTAVVNGKVI
jgi:hypothetical protein